MRRARISTALFVVAGLLLGYWAYETAGMYLRNAAQERRFDRLVEEIELDRLQPPADEVSPAPRDLPPPPAAGDVIGKIEIPSANVSTVVIEGIDDDSLSHGAGHFPGTALPYLDTGNTALAGHRDSFFRGLRNIKQGDEINFSTLAGDYRYTVVGARIVEPDEVWVLDPTEDPALTLVTCYPFNYVGPAPRRFVVRAMRSDPPDAGAAAATQAAR